jgi:hypothetical protein
MDLVRIGAHWCQPCRVVEKALFNLGVQLPYLDADGDEGKGLLAKYNIRSIPAVVDRSTGETFVGQAPIVKLVKDNQVWNNPQYAL